MAVGNNNGNFESRVAEILQVVAASNGHINRDIHESFWNLMGTDKSLNLQDPDVAADFKQQLEEGLGSGLLFQNATWDSVRRTIESGEKTYHPDYKKYYRNMVNKGYVTAAKNADRVIQSALDHSPIENTQGMVYITKAMVNSILKNLEASFERVSMLVAYKWKPKMRERSLRLAHIKTISAFPYAFEKGTVNELTSYFYTSKFTEWSSKSILWLPIENKPLVPNNRALESMTKKLLEYFGVSESDAFIYRADWRGLLANQGSGIGYVSNKKVNISVANVIRTDLGGFLIFIGSSERSQIEADQYVEELLEQTQLAN